MVPSSSAHWAEGRTTSAICAVSERKKSETARKSREASRASTSAAIPAGVGTDVYQSSHSRPSAAAAAAMEAGRARGVRTTGMLVEPDGDGLQELAALVDTGAVRVRVAETFPLDRAADAHRLGEQGRTAGKIVLTI